MRPLLPRFYILKPHPRPPPDIVGPCEPTMVVWWFELFVMTTTREMSISFMEEQEMRGRRGENERRPRNGV